MQTTQTRSKYRERTICDVRTDPASHTKGLIGLGGTVLRCALGRSGIAARKRESDGATPLGVWHPVAVYYRPDRVFRPVTALPVSEIRPFDGWCDASGDRNYNRLVQLPYPASAEQLWRDDHLYDVVVELDHNRCPRVREHGSAVFMHLARGDYEPTEGCIALTLKDLRLLLARMDQRTTLRVLG